MHVQYDRDMAKHEIATRVAKDHQNIGEIDYNTPVPKDEYIGMLKERQALTSDPHMAKEIQKEIKHQKEHGSNSGLK